ncbi:MAG: lipoyl synthase [Deltaproteobacteria bacterium]|nr:lipoyl synthase [Deltaproteobacteria bacterium]
MSAPTVSEPYLRIPPWLRVSLPRTPAYSGTGRLLADLGLHTVCSHAKCPNIFECYAKRTATFLILGSVCTRNCAFCNIAHGPVEPPDPDEPRRVAEAAKRLGLRYVVVTSVTRDDLSDGGAGHFAETIRMLRDGGPGESQRPRVEVLIPDFQGSTEALATVLEAESDVINHNVETPPALYRRIRPQADYGQSLELLRRVVKAGGLAKSGLMVGLGENDEQVRSVLEDLAGVGCRIATVGQYMRPSRFHPPVARYVHPDTFELYAEWGRAAGIEYVFSAPLVRSSYSAGVVFERMRGES